MKNSTTQSGSSKHRIIAILVTCALAIGAMLVSADSAEGTANHPHSAGPKPHGAAVAHGGKPGAQKPTTPAKPMSGKPNIGTAGSAGKGLGGYGSKVMGGFSSKPSGFANGFAGVGGGSGGFGGGFAGKPSGVGGGFGAFGCGFNGHGGGFGAFGSGHNGYGGGFGAFGSGFNGHGGGYGAFGSGFNGHGGGYGGGYGAFGSGVFGYGRPGAAFVGYGSFAGGQFGHFGNLGGQFGLQGSGMLPPIVVSIISRTWNGLGSNVDTSAFLGSPNATGIAGNPNPWSTWHGLGDPFVPFAGNSGIGGG